ncbi:MAG: 2-hydroxyacyl-CoA dehydratase family protein, partial [Desulfuromonadales bacterium]|nr:2-hydroxyacyl-CoA dehydratase family protein [Desulfuromonadales bacterium]
AGELQNTVTTISEQYAGSISEESLRKSIKTFNRYRQLMQELYALRTEDKPKLSGAEAMQITQAGFAMPKEIFNDKLSLALEEIRQRSGHESRARLMICGSYLDDSFLIELIEETGATVVADTLCTGSRHFEGLVDEEADPFTAIADRYLNRISCPRMVGGYEQRLKFAKETAAAARVDGIIFQRLPFCDNHAVENMMEGQSFEDDSIPTLQLEREYLAADKGRLKTRIQAFLEKIGK